MIDLATIIEYSRSPMPNTIEDKLLTDCAKHNQCNGLVLVSIGNTLRQDDGIGQAIIDRLEQDGTVNFCRYDLGTYSNYLIDCLKDHDTAIIIDSTLNAGCPGKVTVFDLNQLISKRQTLKLNSCHGFSLLDELQIANWQGSLPQRLIFFGIEANNCDWTDRLTSILKEKIPDITKQLLSVIVSMSEANNNA